MPLVGFSRYELQERIGIGGMAEVFRARAFDASGESREVVVKKILPHHNEETDFRTMFMDEARIAANLDHPNVVQVLDLGRLDGDLFLAMEYIEGTDLLRFSEWMEGAGRKMPVATALFLAAEVLKGLHHAHTRADAVGRPLGIVHRDVTPQNVMVSAQGAVKLTDFGIARAANRLSHTQVGTIKGNLLYSSPEQVSGSAVDARADVYSAGVLLYRLLAGRHPFDGDELPKIYQRALSGDIPPVSTLNPSIPTNLDRIVARATALVAGQRFASADEFRRALEDFLTGKQLAVDLKTLCSDVRAMKSGLRAAKSKPDGRVLVPEIEDAVLPTSVGGGALEPGAPVPRLSNLPVRQPPPVVEEEKTATMPMVAPPPPPLAVEEEDRTSRTLIPPVLPPAAGEPARAASTILLPATQPAPAEDAAATMVMGLPPLDEAPAASPASAALSRAVAEVLEETSGLVNIPVPAAATPADSSSLSPAVLAALADSAWPDVPESVPDRTVEVPRAPSPPPAVAEPAATPAPPPPVIEVAPPTAPPAAPVIPPPVVTVPLPAAPAPTPSPRRPTLTPAPLPPWELPKTPAATPAPSRPVPTPPPWSANPAERVIELEEEPPPAVVGTIASEPTAPARRPTPAPAPTPLPGPARPMQTPPPWLANSRSAPAPLLSTEWPSPTPGTPTPPPVTPAPVAAEPVFTSPPLVPNLAPPAPPAPPAAPHDPAAFVNQFFAPTPFDDVVEPERTSASMMDPAFAEKVGLPTGAGPGASLEGHTDSVVAVAAVRTGRYVVSASHDHSLRVWDLTTRATQAILKGHNGPVTCVALGKDGSRVLSGGADQTVRLWNTESGQHVATMSGHVERVLAVAVSPDGRTALSGGQDRSVRLWDLSAGREQLVMQGHEQAVSSLCYVGDGSIAVSASFDGMIQMWNLLDGSMLAMFPTGVTGVRAVTVARDGRRLAFGGGDGQVHVWNAEQGVPLLTFPAHDRALLSLALSPDEAQLATASEDGTARLWDFETGKPLGTFETQSGPLHSVAFALEGHTLVGASARRVCVWDLVV